MRKRKNRRKNRIYALKNKEKCKEKNSGTSERSRATVIPEEQSRIQEIVPRAGFGDREITSKVQSIVPVSKRVIVRRVTGPEVVVSLIIRGRGVGTVSWRVRNDFGERAAGRRGKRWLIGGFKATVFGGVVVFPVAPANDEDSRVRVETNGGQRRG